jgi:hypothetical protein
MESSRSQPVFISNGVNEIFTECSFDDNCGEWQDLEQFWGEEKHRLQDVDVQVKQLSSSLEEHLLHDNFLNEPELKNNLVEWTNLGRFLDEFETKTIRGNDVTDVLTAYVSKGYKPRELISIGRGFRPYELIAIGTYVDKDIIPGFRYKVRKNLTEEYLFGGEARHLESVGLGYGKRITFEGDTLNGNENYFWSDSAVDGYGFTFQSVSNKDNFNIVETNTNQMMGRIIVNNPSLKEDTVLSTVTGERGYIEKEIEVQFSCDVILSDKANRQNLFVDDVPVRGKATVARESSNSKAKINQIVPDEFLLESCIFVAEE